MSKFCSNCGCAIDESTRFCPQCGTAASETPAPVTAEEAPVEPAEAAVPVETAPDPAASEPNTPSRKTPYHYVTSAAKPAPAKKKINPKKIITILVSVLVIAAIGLGTFFLLDTFGLLGNFTYKGAMKLYFNSIINADASKLGDMAPEAYWDYLEETYNKDLDEYQEYWEQQYENNRENLEDEYGEDYKIKYKVKSKSEVGKAKLKKMAKALKESYDIKASKVTKGYRLKLDILISGSEGDEDETVTIYALKISGKWYLANVTEYGDGYRVSFLANP